MTSVTRARPFEVNANEYPFADHWFERDGVALHYVDEGHGIPVIMLHGNPTWSFLYRKVIRQVSGQCRCIAPDYPGFGFSEHPRHYGYTPSEHAVWIRELIRHLNLEQFAMVVQDWGGPIGLSVATEMPEQVAGLVIANTFCWPATPVLKLFSWIMGGPQGRYLHLRKNLFATTLMRQALSDPALRTPAVLHAYEAPFPTPASRMGTYVFPRAIRTSHRWLREVEQRLPLLKDKPVELLMGGQDPLLGKEAVIERWLTYFPKANVERVANAGHFIQEEAPAAVAAAIGRLLTR